MSYLDEARFSTYDSNLKEWISSQDSKTITSSIYPWTKTIKANAVSCYPVGGTELKPVVDFVFTEVPPVSGDKGPENPSAISGVSDIFIRRTGVNFLTLPYTSLPSGQTEYTNNGIKYKINNNGSITANGKATNVSYFGLFGASTSSNFPMPSGSYILKSTGQSGVNMLCYDDESNYWASGESSDKIFTFTTSKYGRIYYRIPKNTVLDNVVLYPKVFFNDYTETIFSIDNEYKNTLPLGSTYYGGSIDLATGLITVDWEYVSIDRFSSCYINSSTIRFSYGTDFDTTGYAYGQDPVGACNRFDVVPGGDIEFARQTGNTRELYVAINKSRLDVSDAVDPSNPTSSEWLAAGNVWLVEHPVVFVAKRAVPYTVQLDPVFISALAQADKYTPRLNTVYTDASVVQVGYVKSPIREEYELTQAIVSQGGNI